VSSESRREPPDRLMVGWRLFLVVWSLAAAVFLVVALGAWPRRDDRRAALVEALGLADLAILPSGRAPRHPPLPSVDARFSPRLLEVP